MTNNVDQFEPAKEVITGYMCVRAHTNGRFAYKLVVHAIVAVFIGKFPCVVCSAPEL